MGGPGGGEEGILVQWGTIPMIRCRGITLSLVAAALTVGWAYTLGVQPEPTGEMVWAWHVVNAPSWFDLAETPAQITPFGMHYALHDALVRPLPGERMGNSLAEFWTESSDGLVYEFKLRRGLQFHNGDRCTAEDVQCSFAGAIGLLHRKEASCTNVGRL